MTQSGTLKVLDSPVEVTPSLEDFLHSLGGPTLMRIAGLDNSRTRAVCTLLHGNEPSGMIALHRWLLERRPPAVNLIIFIGSVVAALQPPLFSLRQLPGRRDLNRCFRGPFLDQEGRIAKAFLDSLRQEKPECLVDIHNTSGTGPAFAISIINAPPHQALASLFSHRFIINHLRLGALMEISEYAVPTITAECGGAQDQAAHEVAYEGLVRYVSQEDALSPPQADLDLEILLHPVRIELKTDATLTYSHTPEVGFDLTLPPDVEHLNFGILETDRQLGWLGPRGLDIFQVVAEDGRNMASELFRNVEGRLLPAKPLKAFMITTNPVIAKSDCLFYVVTPQGNPLF